MSEQKNKKIYMLSGPYRADTPAKIIKNIFHAWERALDLQQSEAANPALKYLRWSIRHAEEAQDMTDEADKEAEILQSKILLHTYVMEMRRQLIPAQPVGDEGERPTGEEPKGNANALIKLLGQGGLGGEGFSGGGMSKEVTE